MENMLDVCQWQIIEVKVWFIQQVCKGNFKECQIEDIGGEVVNVVEMKVVVLGNLFIFEEMDICKKLWIFEG